MANTIFRTVCLAFYFENGLKQENTVKLGVLVAVVVAAAAVVVVVVVVVAAATAVVAVSSSYIVSRMHLNTHFYIYSVYECT